MGQVSVLGRTRDDRGDVGNAIATYTASDGQTYIGVLRRFNGAGFAFVEVYSAGPWALVGEADIRGQYNGDIQPALSLGRSRVSGTIIAFVTSGASGARDILRCDTGVAVPAPSEAGAAPTNEQVNDAVARLVASGALKVSDGVNEQQVSAAIASAVSPLSNQIGTIAEAVNRLGQAQPAQPAAITIDYAKVAEAVFDLPPIEGGLGMPDDAQMGTRFQQFFMYCLASPYHMRPFVRAIAEAVEHEIDAKKLGKA